MTIQRYCYSIYLPKESQCGLNTHQMYILAIIYSSQANSLQKHITTPSPNDCFIVTSPYFYGNKCNFYFHVRQLLGKRHKSLTDITELEYKNVTNYMCHHYPELFI